MTATHDHETDLQILLRGVLQLPSFRPSNPTQTVERLLDQIVNASGAVRYGRPSEMVVAGAVRE